MLTFAKIWLSFVGIVIILLLLYEAYTIVPTMTKENWQATGVGIGFLLTIFSTAILAESERF